jgi:hypothetical protein
MAIIHRSGLCSIWTPEVLPAPFDLVSYLTLSLLKQLVTTRPWRSWITSEVTGHQGRVQDERNSVFHLRAGIATSLPRGRSDLPHRCLDPDRSSRTWPPYHHSADYMRDAAHGR